jgi:5-methylcytosine-specific restriction endonuclease McrA
MIDRLPTGYHRRSDGKVVNRYGNVLSAKRLKEVTEMRAGSNKQADQTIDRIRIRDNYTCKHCGVATRDGQVDHIVALVNGGANDDDNLQYLCVDCHEAKTRQDLGQKVRTAFDADGMPTDPNHHWNR